MITEVLPTPTANFLCNETADFFQNLRATEFPNLDKEQHVYLDYTGGNLYPKSLVLQHQDLLLNNILGNPHSINPTSSKATQLVEAARAKVLAFFNATDEYICVFTSNATGALKIVGESYPFNEQSTFLLLSDNHNSVNGIRNFCKAKNGKVDYVPLLVETLEMDESAALAALNNASNAGNNLFAFPAQSNVSGVKHNLDFIAIAQKNGFDVLLDAAAFVPTNQLDLQKWKPNFVSISFYKIFGYPTGIGALLIRKDSFNKLQKPWFAGGTVTLVSVAQQKEFLTNTHERFEDGTVNYENIPAISFGLNFIENLGFEKIQTHILGLAQYLANALLQIKHSNGNPVVRIFGPNGFNNRGGTLIMNFFTKADAVIPFYEIEQLASAQNFSVRCGCFCNPGLDEINNCISSEQMLQYFSSRAEYAFMDMIQFIGKMRGGTRISLGIASNKADVDRFISFAKQFIDK